MKLVKGVRLTILSAIVLATLAGSAGAVEKATDAGGAGGLSLPSASGMSADDEWACKVAMCMANPGGPTEFAECVDPIRKLRRQLAKGKPYPVCRFLGGGGQGGADDGRHGDRNQAQRDPAQAL
jgi:hypothetical protein